MTTKEKLAITKEWADLKYRQEYSTILAKQWIEGRGRKWTK